MGNGRTGGLTRRELATLGATGTAALLLAGGAGRAWAAASAATDQSQGGSPKAGSQKGTASDGSQGASSNGSQSVGSKNGTSKGASSKEVGSSELSEAKATDSQKTGSKADDTKAADSKKGTDGTDAASAEGNKARKFKEIPADALISVDDLYELFSDGALKDRSVYVIDIRSHRDYQNQLIEGSRNIPAGRQFDIRMDEIPQDKQVVLVALKNSNRLAECWFTLIANGYDDGLVKVLDGGVKAWVDAGYPTLEDQFLGC